MHSIILRILPVLCALGALPAEFAFAAEPGASPERLCFDAAVAAPGSNLGYCDLLISQLSEANTTDPTNSHQLASALSNRAIAAHREGAYDSAEADFQRAFDVAGPKPDLLLNRGNLRLAQRRYREALVDYAEALRLSQGTLLAAHYNSAFAHRALGQIPEAVADELRARGHQVNVVSNPGPS